MPDDFEHLHLKRNTKGSSNELSFDVLDAARDGVGLGPDKAGRFTRRMQGSYHGVTGASTFSGQEEVEKKKRRRRRRNLAVRLVTAAVIVALLGAAGWFAYRQYAGMKYFEQRFDTLVEEFVEVDEFLAELDGLVADPLDASKEASREAARGKLNEKHQTLESMRDDAQAMFSLALGEEAKIAIGETAVAAESRLQMLELGGQILDLSKTMCAEQEALNSIWNDVLDADQQARSATELANNATTEEATTEAIEATQRAQDSLKAVCQSLEAAEQEYGDMNLSKQIEYLNARIDSLGYAIATGEALVAGERDKAAAQNELYNKKDQSAAALAEKLPRSIADTVEKAHADQLEKLRKDYKDARAKTIEADTVIREFIGS